MLTMEWPVSYDRALLAYSTSECSVHGQHDKGCMSAIHAAAVYCLTGNPWAAGRVEYLASHQTDF